MEEFKKQVEGFLELSQREYDKAKEEFEDASKTLERAKKVEDCDHELLSDESTFALWEVRCSKCGFSLMY